MDWSYDDDDTTAKTTEAYLYGTYDLRNKDYLNTSKNVRNYEDLGDSIEYR